MEYLYSSIHVEKYKLIFRGDDSQGVAGNAWHVFTHSERIFEYFNIKTGEQFSSYLNIAGSH